MELLVPGISRDALADTPFIEGCVATLHRLILPPQLVSSSCKMWHWRAPAAEQVDASHGFPLKFRQIQQHL
jgi:hypothetical protein